MYRSVKNAEVILPAMFIVVMFVWALVGGVLYYSRELGFSSAVAGFLAAILMIFLMRSIMDGRDAAFNQRQAHYNVSSSTNENGPFYEQAKQVIKDWRNRHVVTSLQVHFLYRRTDELVTDAFLAGIDLKELNLLIKNTLVNVEQKACKSVIHEPKTLCIKVAEYGKVEIIVRGETEKNIQS